MPMKSMRLPPGGTMLGGPESLPERPEFPYGLTIHLDEEALKLLNIGGVPEVGAILKLEARVVVTSAGEHEQQGQGKKRNVSLQITDMELEGAVKAKEAHQLIYTEDN
jgi:hypothetical protein